MIESEYEGSSEEQELNDKKTKQKKHFIPMAWSRIISM